MNRRKTIVRNDNYSKQLRISHLINRLAQLDIVSKKTIARDIGVSTVTLERYLRNPSQLIVERILAALTKLGVHEQLLSIVENGSLDATSITEDNDAIDYKLHTDKEREMLRDIGTVIFYHRR